MCKAKDLLAAKPAPEGLVEQLALRTGQECFARGGATLKKEVEAV
jgi:hypothetical protein